MSDVTFEPVRRPFSATISPPGSKSLTNRALVLAAMASGTTRLSNVLFADDTEVMIQSLKQLGYELSVDAANSVVEVVGERGAVPVASANLFCGNSGTTIRFLTALCALGEGRYTLDGVPRMRQRPIGELVDLLRHMAVRVQYDQADGFPPITLHSDGLAGGIVRYGAARSSQFLSAALMISPFARHEVQVDLEPGQTSWPYVAMTMQLMDAFHLTPELIRDPSTGEPRRIIVPRGSYRAQQMQIEPDASNATYFLAAAALHPGAKVTVQGLGKRSLQGDVGFGDVLHAMGADLIFGSDFTTIIGTDRLEGIEIDLADMPDTAQTLAVVALFARGTTVIRGLQTLRVKETDRLAALSNELSKLGAEVTIEEEGTLVIEPPERVRPASIDTYEDHRMAMSFALAATRTPGITIKDAECVSKTYPHYMVDLRKMLAGESTGPGTRDRS